MGRILAIDYGKKRCGIAVTDPLQIIATALTTVDAHLLRNWLKDYFGQETIELVIIGLPENLDGTDTHATKPVRDFVRLFKKDHPGMPILTVDEQYTSKMAVNAMLEGGYRKKERQRKGLTDELAATIMLRDYLENRR